MKKILTLTLLIVAGLTVNSTFAQEPTPLYGGHRANNELIEIDTTGLSFTIVGTTAMTSDIGTMNGTFGLALHPITEVMYILYDNGSGECDRHLGIVDVITGAISDIGNAGNLVDIDFGPDGTLYGTTGNSCAADHSLVEVDIVTAVTTGVLDYVSGSYGTTIGYNPFADEMIQINRSDISSIDLGTLVETEGIPASHPGECHAVVVLNANLAWVFNYADLYTFNPITGEFIYTANLPDEYQALTFGPPACLPITLDATSYSVCVGTEIILNATSPSDALIMWDGGVIDDIAFEPGDAGIYTYTATSGVDGECDLIVEIEVLDMPIIFPGAGDENFCEDEPIVLSAAGDADSYSWDPIDLMPGVGVHTYTLTGEHDAGCISSATIDITVHALPTITATADHDAICVGNEVVFTAGGGETYVWEDAIIDGEPYTTTIVGTNTYTVVGEDLNGCINTATVNVLVVDEISITGTTTDEIVGDDGSIDITIAGGIVPYIIDWDNDELGDFDDPADLTGLAARTYTIIIKGATGCETTDSFVVNGQLGTKDIIANTIQLYPNPTTENVSIELAGYFQYELITVNGEVLINGSATDKEVISLIDYATGVYFITVKSNALSTTLKVVKD